jgi:hypothetical protein
MKIYGYEDKGLPIEDIQPSLLAEITLVATPAELREIAIFLEEAASNMERLGATYDHEHLSDKKRGFEQSPHFVVFNANRESR